MSEQLVKRYSLSEFAEQYTHPIGPGTYISATDYDALHAEAEALDALCQGRFDEIAQLKAEAEALRDENERLREKHDKAWRHAGVSAENVASLSGQLEAAHALLRESREAYSEATHWEDQQPVMKKIDAFLSATAQPAERNQCDGCQAGVPLVDGAHRMGKPGGYPDAMSCQASKYNNPSKGRNNE